MEKRKCCHCPLKGPVTYLPLICLSLWVGEQPPKSLGMSLPGHLDAGELSEALVSWNLWKCVTCCAKSVGGLLWRPYVSLQTERWFSEVHFLKDWPHYPRVTAAKAHGLSGLTPGFQHVSHAAYCCFLRAEERMEKKEDKWDWMWHGPVATTNPGTAQSGSCHWCNTAHRYIHSTDLALAALFTNFFFFNVSIFKRVSASDTSKLPLKLR